MRRIVGFLLVFAVCFVCSSCRTGDARELPPQTLLRVIFFDVGQGDCALVRTQEGDILIDAGPDASERTLCRKLEEMGVTHLLLAIFTHPDADHIGGADAILSRFCAQEVWSSDAVGESEAYERFVAAASACEVWKTSKDALVRRFGNVGVSVLRAHAEDRESGDVNDGSLVIKITCGEAAALFTGDGSAEMERALVEAYGKSHLSCDLYKVGHHGSADANSALLLEAVKPRYAVISCGADTLLAHPHGAVLSRLGAVGAEIWRTDRDSDVVFDCDGKHFAPKTEKERG